MRGILIGKSSDIIVVNGTQTASVLLGETRDVPVVFVQVSDPIASGLVTSLSRPGGNVTGFYTNEDLLVGKWLELLKETVPGVTNVAVVLSSDSKKATVEGSLVLTASALVRNKALVPGAQTAGSWGWIYEGEDRPHATIRYEADLRDTDNAWLRLHYRANGEAVDYKVQLVTTKPNYGGRRWWFICPIVRRDGGPPRRVAKLYLPSGSKYFGSCEAYALTYASCQDSGFRRLSRARHI